MNKLQSNYIGSGQVLNKIPKKIRTERTAPKSQQPGTAISGRRIENQGILDLQPMENIPNRKFYFVIKKARIVYAQKPRPKSGEGNYRIRPEVEKIVKDRKQPKQAQKHSKLKDVNKSVINYPTEISFVKHKEKDNLKSAKKSRDSSVIIQRKEDKKEINSVPPQKEQRPRSITTQHANKIIKESIKKIIERKSREKLEKQQKEEQLKNQRIELSQKNKEIREMNAHAAPSFLGVHKDSIVEHKHAWGVDQQKLKGSKTKRETNVSIDSFNTNRKKQNINYTNRDRDSMLGLEFIKRYASNLPKEEHGSENKNKENLSKNKVIKPNSNQKICINLNIPERSNESSPSGISKKEIQEYINSKKTQQIAAKKAKLVEKEQRLEKIQQNKAKLSELVHNIFAPIREKHQESILKKSSPCKKPSPTKKSSSSKKNKKLKKSKRNKKKSYDLPFALNIGPNSEIKEGTQEKGAIMKIIKKELLEEIGLSVRKPENLILDNKPEKLDQEINNEKTSEKLRERMDAITKTYEELKKKQKVQSELVKSEKKRENEKANKIQAFYRGYLVRKSLKKPKQKSSIEIQTEQEKIPLQGQSFEEDKLNIVKNVSLEKDNDELIEEEKLQEKLMKEIQSVENQMQNIDIMEPDKKELIHYIDHSVKKISQDSSNSEDALNIPKIKEPEVPIKKSNNNSITEFNPTENQEIANDSLGDLLENQQKQGLFEKNSFHEFTLKKFKDLMKEENLSKIIAMREKLLQFRETTEKKYLTKLYKSKKCSPQSYHRKKAELEKWITKEKVEINKSKKQFIENWKRTADMIEETHQNAIRVKQMVFEGTGFSDTHSTISLALNTSQEAINEDTVKKIMKPRLRAQSEKKPDLIKSPDFEKKSKLQKSQREPIDDDLDAILNDSGENEMLRKEEKIQKSPDIILVKDTEIPKDLESIVLPSISVGLSPVEPKNSPAPPITIISESSYKNTPNSQKSIKSSPQNSKIKHVREAPLAEFKIPTPEKNVAAKLEIASAVQKQEDNSIKNQQKTDEIVGLVFTEILNEEIQKIFKQIPNTNRAPTQKVQPEILPIKSEIQQQIDKSEPKIEEIKKKENKMPPIDGISKPQESNLAALLKQSLLFGSTKGIDFSPEYISDYLELLFSDIIRKGKSQFLNQINTPLIIPPIEILHRLQNDSSPSDIVSIRPSPIPIIPSQTESRISQMLLTEQTDDTDLQRKSQQIYNKALYDAANEGLNLLRPYGLFGEPAPWSAQQRILFKEIVDTGLIVKNVKSMVFFLFPN